jgi:hypothetical protein
MSPSFFRASIAFLLITGAALTVLALNASRELGPVAGILTAQILPPDYAPPTVFIREPYANSILTETATVTAIATDNVDVLGVQFFLDAAPLGSEDFTFPYEFGWNTRTASNTAHALRARARDTTGNTATSTAIEVIVRNPPLPPTNLTAAGIAPTQIKLIWKDNSTSEAGFTVERSENGTAWSVIQGLPDDITEFTNDGLEPKKKYYYRVKAHAASDESPYSNTVNATTPVNAPSATAEPPAPANLVLRIVTPTQIRLTWSDKSANEIRFLVERSTEGGSFSRVEELAPNANFYTDGGLAASTTYRYRVRAQGAATSSLYSNVATIATPREIGGSQSFAAPGNLRVVATSPYAILTTWEDRSTGEDGFALEHSWDGITFRQVNSYNANTTSSTYTGLAPGSRHYYRMRAFRGNIYSVYSNIADVRMPLVGAPLPPGPPPTLPPGGIRPFASTLSIGSCNAEVTILQGFLRKNKTLYPEGTITGCFHSRTEAAVKRFQTKYSIDPIGTVGPRTRAKLNDLYAANQIP